MNRIGILFPDPSSFDKGLVGDVANQTESAGARQARLHSTGAALATRALAHGTAYAVLGCGAIFYAIWWASGATDLADFRRRAGSVLPAVPRNNPPQGRTEFSGINDLLQYLIDEDEKKKKEKSE